MAIKINNTGVVGGIAAPGVGTDISMSPTPGLDQILICIVHWETRTIILDGPFINNIDLNGLPLTFWGQSAFGGLILETWYLINPASGASNIHIDVEGDGDMFISANAIVLSGVDTGVIFGNVDNVAGTSTNPLLTTSTTSRGSFRLLDLMVSTAAVPTLSDTNYTQWANSYSGGGGVRGLDWWRTNKAESETLKWSVASPAPNWMATMYEIKERPYGTTPLQIGG